MKKNNFLKTFFTSLAVVGVGSITLAPIVLNSIDSSVVISNDDVTTQTLNFEDARITKVEGTTVADGVNQVYDLTLTYNMPSSTTAGDRVDKIDALFFEGDITRGFSFDYATPHYTASIPVGIINSTNITTTLYSIAPEEVFNDYMFFIVLLYQVSNVSDPATTTTYYSVPVSGEFRRDPYYFSFVVDYSRIPSVDYITNIETNIDETTGTGSATVDYVIPVEYPILQGGVYTDPLDPNVITPYNASGYYRRAWYRVKDPEGLNRNPWLDAGVNLWMLETQQFTISDLTPYVEYEFKMDTWYGYTPPSSSLARYTYVSGNIVSAVPGYSVLNNLVATPGENIGDINIFWDWLTLDNSILYFAVRNVLFPELGWKVYSSNQTNLITLNPDGSSVTIKDPSFIAESNEYDISMAVFSSETGSAVEYYGSQTWENWSEGTTGGPNKDIIISDTSQYTSSLATPSENPTIESWALETITSDSMKFSFKYDNGSLEFNPQVSAIIDGVDVNSADINMVLTDDIDPVTGEIISGVGTGIVELLRLTPETTYDNIEFTLDYGYSDGIFSGLLTEGYITLANVPSVNIETEFVSFTSEYVVRVTGNEFKDSNITNGGLSNIIITNSTLETETLDLLDATDESDTLIGIYRFDLSTWTSTDNIALSILTYDLVTSDLIDNVNQFSVNEIGAKVTTYYFGSNIAINSNINDITGVVAYTGTKNGELDIDWSVIYPQGTTLSDLEFTFEVSSQGPEETQVWYDFTDLTMGISDSMDSTTITGLGGQLFNEGVWVRVTVNYLEQPVITTKTTSSTVSAIPKQPVLPQFAPYSGLSTGALIGVIIGSVAGVALISLGVLFYIKKIKPDSDNQEPKVKVKKEPKEKIKKESKKKIKE